jgi:protein required for attachment to host cells
MNIWIVAADEREALFYDAQGARHSMSERDLGATSHWADPYKLVLRISNPQARPDRELETDRPGRGFNSATGQRHAIVGERSTRRTDQVYFAKRLAEEIEHARHARRFDCFVLAAGPRMLGLIRAELTDASRACIAAEIAKDLVKLDKLELIERLPFRVIPRPGLRH